MLVLVADDDAIARMILTRQLGVLGVTTVEAVDGTDALAKASEQRFDLVLLDRSMPGANGFEVARSIRAGASAHTAASVPLVAVSGDGEDQLPTYLAAGFDDLVTKPATGERLAKVINRWNSAAA
jgi:two-component system, sensor histidine kinase